MMKAVGRIFLSVFLACILNLSGAHAQDTSSGVVANFHAEKHLTGFKKPWMSSGCFAVVPDIGLVWKVEKPFPSVIEVSDAGVKSISSSGQAQILEGAALPVLRTLKKTLVSAFLGEWHQMSSMFLVKDHNLKDGYYVTLTPKRADVPFHELDIHGKKFVTSVHIENRAGDVDDMVFFGHRKITSNSISELSAFVQKCP